MIQNNNSEKHCISARRLRRIRSKKARKLLVCLTALLCMALVGATVAFLVTRTGSVTNTFQGSKVACAVIENGNNKDETSGIVSVAEKKNVQIKNTGDTDAYIRVAVVVNWMSEDGSKVWALKPTSDDYTITYILGADGWLDGGDGYYYYSKPVAPKDPTSILIEKAMLKDGITGPVGTDGTQYYLSIEIVASAIQSTPIDVVEKQWLTGGNIVVDEKSGNLSIPTTTN